MFHGLSHCGLGECACCCSSGIKQYMAVYQTQRTCLIFMQCKFSSWRFKISRRPINFFHFFQSCWVLIDNSWDRGSINDSGLYSAGPHFESRPQQLLPRVRRIYRDISQCLLAFELYEYLKNKGIPRQAEVALGVPGRLRPRIFSTFDTTRVVGRQPNAPAAFTPGENPGTHFPRLSRPQGTWFLSKGTTGKIPSDTTGDRSRDSPTSGAVS